MYVRVGIRIGIRLLGGYLRLLDSYGAAWTATGEIPDDSESPINMNPAAKSFCIALGLHSCLGSYGGSALKIVACHISELLFNRNKRKPNRGWLCICDLLLPHDLPSLEHIASADFTTKVLILELFNPLVIFRISPRHPPGDRY